MELSSEDRSKISTVVEAELHNMDWSMLQVLNNYRAFLVVTIAIIGYFSTSSISIGTVGTNLFSVALLVYVVFAGLFSVGIRLKTPDIVTQFYVQSYLDIIMLNTMMYFGGGVQSGLSILLVISIAILSHCSAPRYAMLFAALASVMILTQEMLTAHSAGYSEARLIQAAVTGFTLFGTAYLVSVILPLRQKEAMKSQYAEIQNLTTANSIITSDLRLAADLQASLLPAPTWFGKSNVAGSCHPALFVAGDIFDFFLINPKTLVMYMADVVGHGTASAMISYAVHGQLHPRKDGMCLRNFNESADSIEFVHKTMQQLNDSFTDSLETDHYFTLHFSVLNLETGELTFSQAGHPLPILHKADDGSVQEVGNGGMPIGIFEGAEIDVCQIQLSAGDTFVVYSDGATECFSPDEKQFGVYRLMGEIRESSEKTLDEFQESLIETLADWQKSSEFNDDVSILRLQYGK